MRIEAAKLSLAKCKIKARMRIEGANFFRTYVDVRRQTDRQQRFPLLNALHGARSGSPQLYIYIYIYISVTARPLSPHEGARSRSPQLF